MIHARAVRACKAGRRLNGMNTRVINYITEGLESYRPGKFHPVHLGDTFHNSRYEVIRKLGFGSFSTVWLAKDKR